MVAEWSTVNLKFKYRECLRSQVPIPARDYNIDRSEVEILCQIAGCQVTCVTYNIEPNIDAIRHAQCA